MSWPNVSGYVFTHFRTSPTEGQAYNGQIYQLLMLFDKNNFKKGVVSPNTGVDFSNALGSLYGFGAGDVLNVSFTNPGGAVVIDNSEVKSLPGSQAAPEVYDQLSGKRMTGVRTVQWEGQSLSQYGTQHYSMIQRLNKSNVMLATVNLKQSAQFPYSITINGSPPNHGTHFQFKNLYGPKFRGLLSVYGKMDMTGKGAAFFNNRWRIGLVGSGSGYIISKYVTLSGAALPTPSTPPRPRPQPAPQPPQQPPPPSPPPAPPPPDPPATFNPEPPADAPSKYLGLKCPIVLPEVNGISSQTTHLSKATAFKARGR